MTDFVVYLGDVITANNVMIANASLYWDQAISPTKARGMPWASVFGNHDDAPFVWPLEWFSATGIPQLREEDCSFRGTERLELMKNEIKDNALSYSKTGPKELWPSVSNYVLQLLPANGSPSPVALLKDFTRGLKKSFKEDNIIKQPEVMGAMSKWWHCGYLRKNYDETYQGSSSDEGNGEEEVNDEDWSEEEDICLPRPTKKKKKSKGERKKKKVPLFITTRCSPRKFVSLIGTLTTDQREAIKAFNPFHTLLGVKCGHMHRAFAMHLVQCFNPETCSIEFRRGVVVHITEEDVARVLGMPIGDTPVPTECLESHRQKIQQDFHGGYKEIKIVELENEIKKQSTDGTFHRAFMLFTLGCLLCPTTKEVVGSRLFPGVVADDLQTLKTYKWPAFVLDWLVIYFDLNPLDVEVGNELDPPIGSWTKEFIDVRISKEMEDMPIEDSVFSQFPPHNLKNQICIDMYKEHMRQFIKNSKFLHEMDASMGEPVVGSPVVGSPQDGPRAEPVQDEGHSPQFSPNFELYEYGQQGEGEGEGDQIQEKGEGEEEEEEDGDQIKETRDEIEEEGEVGGTKIIHGSASTKRKQEEVVISTDPTKRKRRRNVKPSPSIKSPYVAQPIVKTTKLTEEEEAIIKYLLKGPTNELSEVLIRIEGAKWPLTRKEVGESFRPRGLVCNMVMYTFTEWRMMKERAVATNGRPSRHIFAPAFASNLLATKSDEFSTVLRDDCDPDKLGYDLLKCDMLFLPVLESDHWFCVCISLVESRVYILDSMKGKEENVEQLEQVGSIVLLARRTNLVELKKSIEEKASAVKSADDGAADLKKRVEELSKSLEESEKDYQVMPNKPLENAETELKQLKTKISHSEKELKEKSQQLLSKREEAVAAENELHTRSKDVESVQKALESLPYEDGKMEALQKDRASELEVVQKFVDEIQILSAQLANVDFTYRDPVNNFDRSKVIGVVAKLIKVKDSSTLTALEVAAGGKMFNVLVDTENTGKQLLQNGELRRRVTIIPLNKIQSHPVPLRVQNTAVRLVGKGNAEVALSLVGYAEELKVAFNNEIGTRSVTLEGDIFQPSGLLTGGSRKGGGDLLRQLHALAEAESELSVHQKTLSVIEAKISELLPLHKKFKDLKAQLELKS
ncbi:hypothetical protein RHGRI_006433 [Rhododendron griersonianum]|uniref:SMC hinge domain-containing protein n=1 Tax=Rhododendron griersonianum TaxID=479676 RepID=A0AAV6KUQ6_9ERIC|nr:hypothetical protein RHGRI_006433 [Rhododendron griersonianum]